MPRIYCLTGPNYGDSPHIVFREMETRVAMLLSRLARNPKYRDDVLKTVDRTRMPFLHAALIEKLGDENALFSLRANTDRLLVPLVENQDIVIDRVSPGVSSTCAEGFAGNLCTAVMLSAQDGGAGLYVFSTDAPEPELVKSAEMYTSAMRLYPLFSNEYFDRKDFPELSKIAEFGKIAVPTQKVEPMDSAAREMPQIPFSLSF